MKAEDYIKDGDGIKVYINRKGMQMFNLFIAKSGGGKKVAEETGLHENTIVNFKRDCTCSYDTWNTIFNAMTKQTA